MVDVLAIFGPTASGKSDVAAAIADHIPARLISADAMQVYRGLPILTNQSARPTELVGIWELDHEVAVGEYAQLAHGAIDRALADGVTPVVVGGTGLYLRAALVELDLPPAPEPGGRQRWEAEYDRLGTTAAHDLLAERDPAAAALVHPHDRRRVVRALELAEMGASLAPDEDRLWSEEVRRPTLVAGLDVPPQRLDERIRTRAEAMLAAGAVEEARTVVAAGVSRTAEKTLGLRELTELPTADALERLIVRTRRYAAYQRKWMRRIPGIVMIDADRPANQVADAILEVARAR